MISLISAEIRWRVHRCCRPPLAWECALIATVALFVSCENPVQVSQGERTVAPSIPSSTKPNALQLVPGIRVDLQASQVIVSAQVAARSGWLEQLVCKAGTREHESLLAVEVAPRLIHGAILAIGINPGSPGRWTEGEADAAGQPTLDFVPPTGDGVDLRVTWDLEGVHHEASLCDWVRSAPLEVQSGERAVDFPCDRFVFAGSHVRANPPSLGKGEHYVADFTGSIVGLVTFGDEVIAFEEVIPDRVEFAPAMWEAWTERIPAEGTPVNLIIGRRWASGR